MRFPRGLPPEVRPAVAGGLGAIADAGRSPDAGCRREAAHG